MMKVNKNRILSLGAHTSIAGGIYHAISNGEQIAADVVQIFSKNQRQWKGRAYASEELETFFRLRRESGIEPVVIHGSYLINLASPEESTRNKSIAAFADELRRAAQLQIPYLLTHPGSHLGAGESAGVRRVAVSLRAAWEIAAVSGVMILLETTAGQGTNLGNDFAHLRDIIAHSGMPLGICIDTCHIFAAGYDLRTEDDWAATRGGFEQIIGLSRLKLFHLNDSQHPLNSRRDRHARIGQGEIGAAGFAAILNDPQVNRLPMILEVPGGIEGYREDLVLLRKLAGL